MADKLFVQTVLGPVLPQNLGRTLTHEHFLLDFSDFYVPAPAQIAPYIGKEINLSNVGLVKHYPYSSHLNINFRDVATEEAVLYDVEMYQKWGGGAIVENSTHGLKGNRQFSRFVARKTNVNVIHGTGHYVESVQPAGALKMSIEEMTDLYLNDIRIGIDDVSGEDPIKCGVIGEVGSSWPISDFEKRSIQATAHAQVELNCGVSFHPGRDAAAPFEIVRLYLEAGGKADKCVMSHLDRTLHDIDVLLEFAKLGVYCQMDLFGVECSYYQLNPMVDMPSDGQRIQKVIQLIDEGYVERLLLSHDIHTKHRLLKFGGHGYAHIINNVLPKLQIRGVTATQIDQITIKNPANWLQFSLP